MGRTEDVSVIICAYTEKRWNELVLAVESVQRQTMQPEEIIVVIDRNDGLLAKARKELAGVVVIGNTEVKGASGARNCGAKIAQGKILAFLDDDAIAQPEWIERLMVCYSDPQVVGVGGKINPLWIGDRPQWFPEEFNWVVGCSYRGLPAQNAAVRNLIGANMSVRKAILLGAGGFRAAFGNNKSTSATAPSAKFLHHQAGDEETELCIRITQQRPESVWLYTASAVVWHHVPSQRARVSYFLWRCYDEGLGKASLVRMHGKKTSLASEAAYTYKTLPAGVLHGITDALLKQDSVGLARAGAIMLGFFMAATGYAVGRISSTGATFDNTPIPALETPSPIEV